MRLGCVEAIQGYFLNKHSRGKKEEEERNIVLSSSLMCRRGLNPDPDRPTVITAVMIKPVLFGRMQGPPLLWKPEAARASQATEPAPAAATLQAAAHARTPTEAARGQAPRAGYSPRHPQAGMAALRDTGCGMFAPAAARAEPHEPRRATRPRTRSLAEPGSTTRVTARTHAPQPRPAA